MPFRVLVVDDSNFFQQRLKEIINQHPELEVIGVASNGRDAVEMATRLKPDIITMDFEMPVMDGVTAVRHIMRDRPTPILMLSSLTYEGARVTLDALAAGATDFMAKDFAEISRSANSLSAKLHDRLLTLGRGARASASRVSSAAPSTSATPARPAPTASPRPAASDRPGALRRRFQLLVIGASTGGPVALTEVLTKLPRNFPLPIVLVQHMPENFTKAFAERLNRQSEIQVREAVDGDRLEPGLALLAPGGKQLMVERRAQGVVKVLPDDARVNYKPSLDITFGSAANAYADKVLGVVLTGMGSDGCKGAEMLKKAGSVIWSQDEATSIIYGMPMAVARANLTDQVLALPDIGPMLTREVM
ncbi:protein-glutamate methylesterase/protein-glutamine glutaminase [Marinimicrobium alkaliphilum]|uniref:protein-glutamate methylesterase/protein-glutamine glutaminase n=1 Tax=Marinimicrobium alkaliphilum TaxID=2202654 RepID=UPI000DBA3683|nr:chemotaxis response regulator protein-glutamate methylesterase [Marinimicrobium alkaliphilum]